MKSLKWRKLHQMFRNFPGICFWCCPIIHSSKRALWTVTNGTCLLSFLGKELAWRHKSFSDTIFLVLLVSSGIIAWCQAPLVGLPRMRWIISLISTDFNHWAHPLDSWRGFVSHMTEKGCVVAVFVDSLSSAGEGISQLTPLAECFTSNITEVKPKDFFPFKKRITGKISPFNYMVTVDHLTVQSKFWITTNIDFAYYYTLNE